MVNLRYDVGWPLQVRCLINGPPLLLHYRIDAWAFGSFKSTVFQYSIHHASKKETIKTVYACHLYVYPPPRVYFHHEVPLMVKQVLWHGRAMGNMLSYIIWIWVPCDIVHWSAEPHRTGLGVCGVLVLSVIMCSYYYLLDEFYFIMIFIMTVVTIIGIFMAVVSILNYTFRISVSGSGSANAQHTGCFHPWTFSLNIGLNMLNSDSFISCLHYLLGYSTGEFQAL